MVASPRRSNRFLLLERGRRESERARHRVEGVAVEREAVEEEELRVRLLAVRDVELLELYRVS